MAGTASALGTGFGVSTGTAGFVGGSVLGVGGHRATEVVVGALTRRVRARRSRRGKPHRPLLVSKPEALAASADRGLLRHAASAARRSQLLISSPGSVLKQAAITHCKWDHDPSE